MEYDYNKSLGQHKRKYLFINKYNKGKYKNTKSNQSSSKSLRTLILSEINGILNSHNKNIDNYSIPCIYKKTLNYWDCKPWKHKPQSTHQC